MLSLDEADWLLRAWTLHDAALPPVERIEVADLLQALFDSTSQNPGADDALRAELRDASHNGGGHLTSTVREVARRHEVGPVFALDRERHQAACRTEAMLAKVQAEIRELTGEPDDDDEDLL